MMLSIEKLWITATLNINIDYEDRLQYIWNDNLLNDFV